MDMNVVEFTNRLKEQGCYIGEDSHLYSACHKPLSRKSRNGYYVARKYIDGDTRYFMEHRVVWVWHYNSMDDSLVINHMDFDKSNNHIGNLELISQAENVAHAKRSGRLNPARAEDNGKTNLSNKKVKAIRYLYSMGYSQPSLASLFKIPNVNTISRLVNKRRFSSVDDAESCLEIYSEFVRAMTDKGFNHDQMILEATLGMASESGEVGDIVKKWKFQGHDLDINALVDELGDVLFYIAMLCNELHMDFLELIQANIDKLQARYPDGFDPERSVHRDEVAL